MKNGIEIDNDHTNIDTLKAGEDPTSKNVAKRYTKYLSDRRIHIVWKNAKMVIIVKNGNKKALTNCRPIYRLRNVCKVLTNVTTNKLDKTLNENQPLEQAGFRSSYSMTDNVIN